MSISLSNIQPNRYYNSTRLYIYIDNKLPNLRAMHQPTIEHLESVIIARNDLLTVMSRKLEREQEESWNASKKAARQRIMFRREIKKRDQRIQELQTMVNAQKHKPKGWGDIHSLQIRIDDAEQEIYKLREVIEGKDLDIESATSQVDAKNEMIRILKEQMVESRKEIDEHKKEVDRLREVLSDSDRSKLELQKSMNELLKYDNLALEKRKNSVMQLDNLSSVAHKQFISDSDMEKFVALSNSMNSALSQLMSTANEIDDFQTLQAVDTVGAEWKSFLGNDDGKRKFVDNLMEQLIEKKEMVMKAIGPNPDLMWIRWSQSIDHVARTSQIGDLPALLPPIDAIDFPRARSEQESSSYEMEEIQEERSGMQKAKMPPMESSVFEVKDPRHEPQTGLEIEVVESATIPMSTDVRMIELHAFQKKEDKYRKQIFELQQQIENQKKALIAMTKALKINGKERHKAIAVEQNVDGVTSMNKLSVENTVSLYTRDGLLNVVKANEDRNSLFEATKVDESATSPIMKCVSNGKDEEIKRLRAQLELERENSIENERVLGMFMEQERMRLESLLAEQDAELGRLKAMLKEKGANLEIVMEETSKREEYETATNQEVQRKKKEIINLQRVIEAKDIDIEAKTNRLEDQRAVIRRVHSEMCVLRTTLIAELNRQESEEGMLNLQVAAAEQEIERLDQIMYQKDICIGKKETELQFQKEIIRKLKEQKKHLQEPQYPVHDAQREIEEIRRIIEVTNMDTLERDNGIDDQHAIIRKLDEEIIELKAVTSNDIEEVAETGDSGEETNTGMQELESMIIKRDEEIEGLTQIIDVMEADAKILAEEYDAKIGKLNEALRAKDLINKEATEMMKWELKQWTEAQQVHHEVRKLLTKTNSELEAAKNELEGKEWEIDGLRRIIGSKNIDITEVLRGEHVEPSPTDKMLTKRLTLRFGGNMNKMAAFLKSEGVTLKMFAAEAVRWSMGDQFGQIELTVDDVRRNGVVIAFTLMVEEDAGPIILDDAVREMNKNIGRTFHEPWTGKYAMQWKLKGLETEGETLGNNKDLKELLHKATVRLKLANNQRIEQSEEMERVKSTLNHRETQMDSLKQTISNLRNELDAKNEMTRSLIHGLRKEMDRLYVALNEKEADELHSVQGKHEEEYKQQIIKMQKGIKSQHDEVSKWKSLMMVRNREVQRLKSALKQHAAIDHNTAKLQLEKEGEIRVLNTRIADAEKRINELLEKQQDLDVLIAEVKELNEKLNDKEVELKTINDGMTASRNRQGARNASVLQQVEAETEDQYRPNIAVLEQQIEDQQKAMRTMSKALKKSKLKEIRNKNEFRKNIVEMEKELEDSERVKWKLNQKEAQLQAMMAKEGAQNKVKMEKDSAIRAKWIAGLLRVIEAKDMDILERDNRIDDQQDIIKKLDEEMLDLKEALRAHRVDGKELAHRVEEGERQRVDADAELKRKEEEAVRRESELRQYIAEIRKELDEVMRVVDDKGKVQKAQSDSDKRNRPKRRTSLEQRIVVAQQQLEIKRLNGMIRSLIGGLRKKMDRLYVAPPQIASDSISRAPQTASEKSLIEPAISPMSIGVVLNTVPQSLKVGKQLHSTRGKKENEDSQQIAQMHERIERQNGEIVKWRSLMMTRDREVLRLQSVLKEHATIDENMRLSRNRQAAGRSSFQHTEEALIRLQGEVRELQSLLGGDTNNRSGGSKSKKIMMDDSDGHHTTTITCITKDLVGIRGQVIGALSLLDAMVENSRKISEIDVKQISLLPNPETTSVAALQRANAALKKSEATVHELKRRLSEKKKEIEGITNELKNDRMGGLTEENQILHSELEQCEYEVRVSRSSRERDEFYEKTRISSVHLDRELQKLFAPTNEKRSTYKSQAFTFLFILLLSIVALVQDTNVWISVESADDHELHRTSKMIKQTDALGELQAQLEIFSNIKEQLHFEVAGYRIEQMEWEHSLSEKEVKLQQLLEDRSEMDSQRDEIQRLIAELQQLRTSKEQMELEFDGQRDELRKVIQEQERKIANLEDQLRSEMQAAELKDMEVNHQKHLIIEMEEQLKSLEMVEATNQRLHDQLSQVVVENEENIALRQKLNEDIVRLNIERKSMESKMEKLEKQRVAEQREAKSEISRLESLMELSDLAGNRNGDAEEADDTFPVIDYLSVDQDYLNDLEDQLELELLIVEVRGSKIQRQQYLMSELRERIEILKRARDFDQQRRDEFREIIAENENHIDMLQQNISALHLERESILHDQHLLVSLPNQSDTESVVHDIEVSVDDQSEEMELLQPHIVIPEGTMRMDSVLREQMSGMVWMEEYGDDEVRGTKTEDVGSLDRELVNSLSQTAVIELTEPRMEIPVDAIRMNSVFRDQIRRKNEHNDFMMQITENGWSAWRKYLLLIATGTTSAIASFVAMGWSMAEKEGVRVPEETEKWYRSPNGRMRRS